MAEAPTITWTVTIDQANFILSCLGRQKFDRVAELLIALRQQAGEQVQRAQQAPPALTEGPPLPGLTPNGHAAAAAA